MSLHDHLSCWMKKQEQVKQWYVLYHLKPLRGGRGPQKAALQTEGIFHIAAAGGTDCWSAREGHSCARCAVI